MINDISLPDVPHSFVEGRYTIALWLMIDDTTQLTSGFNIQYEDHMTMHITGKGTKLHTKCFPNGLTDKPQSTITSTIESDVAAQKFINTDFQETDLASGIWNVVYCSANLQEGKYYLNTNVVKPLLPNTTLNSATNLTWNRNFNIPDLTTVTKTTVNLKGMSTSGNARIFFKNLLILRDYLPQELHSKFFFNKDFNLLIVDTFKLMVAFNSDLSDTTLNTYDGVANPPTLKVKYTVLPSTGTPAVKESAAINTLANKVYSNDFYWYGLTLCGLEQHKSPYTNTSTYLSLSSLSCSDISTGDCTAGSYCLSSETVPNAYYTRFWCSADVLRVSDLSCQTASTAHGYNSESMFDYIDLTKYDQLADGSCNAGNTKFYFNCIPNTLNTSLLLSGESGFRDIIYTTGAELANKKVYSFEVWFYGLNFTPNTAVVNGNELYYFIAPPHKFYHKGVASTALQYVFDSNAAAGLGNNLNQKEWNNIFISSDATNVSTFFNYSVANKVTNTSSDFMGFLFCNKSTTCALGTDYKNLIWGNAIYKNIRLFTATYTLDQWLQLITATTTNFSNIAIFYFDFDVKNYVPDANDTYAVNSLVGTNIKLILNTENKNRGYNIVLDYDYIKKNVPAGGQFINIITDKPTTNSSLASCTDSNCNRCFKSGANQCYECKVGYMISNLTCILGSASFFKPPLDSDITLSNITLASHNKFTVGIYFKFLSENLAENTTTVETKVYRKLFSIDSGNNAYLAYSSIDNNFAVVYNSKLAYIIDGTTYPLIGKWYFIGLSVYRSPDATIHPHMQNVQFMKNIIPINAAYKTSGDGDANLYSIPGNEIRFFKQTQSLYADLRIYSSFIKGPYGVAQNRTSSYRSMYLVRNVPLVIGKTGSIFSTGQSSCLTASQITSGSLTNLECVLDYNPLFQSNQRCNSDDIAPNASCPNCNAECSFSANSSITGFTGPEMACSKKAIAYVDCTCHIHRFSYYLLDNNKCKPIENLNFHNFQDIDVSVPSSQNNEMTIEFWSYIYSYTPTNLNEYNVIWDKHNRIKIYADASGKYKATCYPFVNKANLPQYETIKFDGQAINMGAWNFIRCSLVND